MKEYPSITKQINDKIKIFCFIKNDGSLIRSTYNHKKGFYKFGSRTKLITEQDKPLGAAITMFNFKYNEDLCKIFFDNYKKIENVTCFMEFVGPKSFAGNHQINDDFQLKLFDIAPYKMGILPPTEYLKLVGHLDISPVIYEGFADDEFYQQVKNGTLPGLDKCINEVPEGIVAKGKLDNNTKMPIMFKVKTNAWLNKLREFCGNNHALYKQLE